MIEHCIFYPLNVNDLHVTFGIIFTYLNVHSVDIIEFPIFANEVTLSMVIVVSNVFTCAFTNRPYEHSVCYNSPVIWS
jgi:hypothetical protein